MNESAQQFPYHGRPTLRAVDAAGAAPGLGAIYAAAPCPRSYRSMEAASGATDAVRWAAFEHLSQISGS